MLAMTTLVIAYLVLRLESTPVMETISVIAWSLLIFTIPMALLVWALVVILSH